MPLPRYCRKCQQRFEPSGRYSRVCYDCYNGQRRTLAQRNKGKAEIKRLEQRIRQIRFDARIHPLMRLEMKAEAEMFINAIRHSLANNIR